MAKNRKGESDLTILVIGIFKLVKCASLLALGAALIHWQNKDLREMASRWLGNVWLGRSYFDTVLVKLSLMRKDTIDKFAVGSFVYAVLLSVEGVGLCLRKRWAEFLT